VEIKQKERIQFLINEIKNTEFYAPDSFPERAEIGMHILQGQIDRLKLYVKRIEDDFINKEVANLNSEFESQDYREGMRQFNLMLPLLDEIEDYLLDKNYNSITNFTLDSRNKKVNNEMETKHIESVEIHEIKKEIAKGNLESALEMLLSIKNRENMSSDNILLAQNRLATIKGEYEKGIIEFENFIRLNTTIVIAVISEINEID